MPSDRVQYITWKSISGHTSYLTSIDVLLSVKLTDIPYYEIIMHESYDQNVVHLFFLFLVAGAHANLLTIVWKVSSNRIMFWLL